MSGKAKPVGDLMSIIGEGGQASKMAETTEPSAVPAAVPSPRPVGEKPAPKRAQTTGRATRQRRVRITVDLEPRQYQASKELQTEAFMELGRKIDGSALLRAVIEVLAEDPAVKAKTFARLRKSVSQ